MHLSLEIIDLIHSFSDIFTRTNIDTALCRSSRKHYPQWLAELAKTQGEKRHFYKYTESHDDGITLHKVESVYGIEHTYSTSRVSKEDAKCIVASAELRRRSITTFDQLFASLPKLLNSVDGVVFTHDGPEFRRYLATLSKHEQDHAEKVMVETKSSHVLFLREYLPYGKPHRVNPCLIAYEVSAPSRFGHTTSCSYYGWMGCGFVDMSDIRDAMRTAARKKREFFDAKTNTETE